MWEPPAHNAGPARVFLHGSYTWYSVWNIWGPTFTTCYIRVLSTTPTEGPKTTDPDRTTGGTSTRDYQTLEERREIL